MNAYAYGLSNPLTYIDNKGQLANFALQAVWWGLRQAGAAYIRCFGQCLVASATEASIGVLWQYMMGDCEPGFEFSGMAVLAMQSCGYSCLNPRNWGGKRAKASTKSKAYESRANGGGKAAVKKYEVGTFNDLSDRSVKGDKLDIHHAMQKHPAGQIVDGYDPKKAPFMAVPQREHRRIPTIKGPYSGSPRDLLAKDVKDLRN